MHEESCILLAEDDENDLTLFEFALVKAKVSNPLQTVRNGQQAIDYLSGKGIYTDRVHYPWPALMLLDLKMPIVDGFEVLQWWAKQDQRQRLPIVVMSSSSRESDVEKAMVLGAAAYTVKPGDLKELVQIVGELHRKWLQPVMYGRVLNHVAQTASFDQSRSID